MESAAPIQILTPDDHKYKLELENFKEIIDQNYVKDRNVVVVSIAGAFRKGKSFLLNFFLKYLYSQVKASLSCLFIYKFHAFFFVYFFRIPPNT